MKTNCRVFRDFVLEKDNAQKLSPQAQQHLQICDDCRVFYAQYRQMFDALNESKRPVIPERVQRKSDRRILSHSKQNRPAYILAALLTLFVSLFLFRQNHVFHSPEKTNGLRLDYVLYRGKPASVYLEQSRNYIHIFISNKGD